MKMGKMDRVLHWTPRILSILFICFIALFSLDVFEPGASVTDIAIGLFMHNIPTLIMIVFLVVAWRIELVGTVGFFGFGLYFIWRMLGNVFRSGFSVPVGVPGSVIIAVPAFVIGFLFLIDWMRKRKRSSQKG